MFGLFKSDPTKKLKKRHDLILEKAVHAQRNGKMAEFAKLSAQADILYKQILEIREELAKQKS